MVILVKINVDKLGNKTTAVVNYNGQYLEGTVSSLIEYIQNGHYVKNAKIINNDLRLIPSVYNFNDLSGKTVKGWYIQEYIGNKQYLCVDADNHKKVIWAISLKNGTPEDFERTSSRREDLAGVKKYDWTFLKYVGDRKWLCECSCGTQRIVSRANIINGKSKCCGGPAHTIIDLTGQLIGAWHIKECTGRHDNKTWFRCVCECGREREVDAQMLREFRSLSCGTCNRSNEQLEMVKTKENFENIVKNLYNKIHSKITIKELANTIGLSTQTTLDYIHKYNVEQYVELTHSNFEDSVLAVLYELIDKNEIQLNNRTALNNKELDIYVPKFNFAIECNGDYWHSIDYKSKNYHIEKSLECMTKQIRLIHIFEHEWANLSTRYKLIELIKSILNINQKIIYARKTIIRQLTTKQSRDFLNAYHLQSYVVSETNLGLFFEDELVEVMTFGKPRFSTDYDIELYRLCTKHGCKVIGGAEKLFKHFVSNTSAKTIGSYCNILKFTGEVYNRLGFINDKCTPGYVYVNLHTLEALTRQQCTKQKLIETGYGTDEQTELEIMRKRNYVKIYTIGNILYKYSIIGE